MNDPKRLSRVGRRSRLNLLNLIFLSLVIGLAAQCGDDDNDNGTPPIEEGLQGLQNFGSEASNSTEARALQAPAVASLLQAFGLSIDGTVPFSAAAQHPSHKKDGALPGYGRLMPRALIEGFGTYDRDSTSTAPPFPGWVLAEADVPPDGFIFRFQADDDIVIIEPGGPRHIAGEIRFLEIEVDDNQTPLEPNDDILTHVHFEIEIVDEAPHPLIRLEYHATLDENREVETLEIGDEADLDASYFGDISLAISLDGTSDDLNGLIQLVDRTVAPDYVVRFGFAATDLDSTKTPNEAAFNFGFGPSDDPASPPWLISAAFTNFRLDTESQLVIADVTGTITYNGRLAATLAGDTSEIPVDVDTDGDGDVDADDTCINVNITQAGSDNAENICEALGGDLVDSIPFAGGDPLGFRIPLAN